MVAKKRSRVIIYGNDLYREIITPNAKGAITFTYWDLWISIILVNEFDSDWDKMIDYFRSKKKGYSFQRDGAEALINHLHMLRQMFVQSELSLVESILQKQRDELCELEIEYQAEKALTMLGMVYVQHQLFDKFVPTAKIMGTREWERITTMSEMAEIHQKYDIALAVYEACLGPGSHEDFLRKKYKKLKGRHGQPS